MGGYHGSLSLSSGESSHCGGGSGVELYDDT